MATLTLKNIPHRLHRRLKASARRNRRSLNGEILARLERQLTAGRRRPASQAKAVAALAARVRRLERGQRKRR